MGGRGASSGAGGGIAPELIRGKDTMTLDEYLGRQGLSDVLSGWVDDKLRSNKQIRTQRGRKKFYKDNLNAINNYHERRTKAINDYNQMVSEGKIKQPTSLQRHYENAKGHPDLAATQASRRILLKKGYDWRTGKKIKG